MNKTRLFLLTLVVIGCSQKNESKDSKADVINPLSAQYIVLESNEGDRFCLSYSELIHVTPYDYLNFQIGQKKRKEIVSGVVRLNSTDFDQLISKSDKAIYKLADKVNSMEIDSITSSALDKSGVLKLKIASPEIRGNIIAEAINDGYTISFDDHQGEYLWSRK